MSDRRPRPSRRLYCWARAGSAVLASCLVVVVAAGCGGGAPTPTGTPTGTYTTSIPIAHTPLGKLEGGTWTLTMPTKGTFSISQSAEVGLGVGKGSYVKGTTFVINPLYRNTCGPGRGTGVYKLRLSGNTLTFVRSKDPCTVRRDILSHTFTKVD
jgi:hypothetical protein